MGRLISNDGFSPPEKPPLDLSKDSRAWGEKRFQLCPDCPEARFEPCEDPCHLPEDGAPPEREDPKPLQPPREPELPDEPADRLLNELRSWLRSWGVLLNLRQLAPDWACPRLEAPLEKPRAPCE